MQSYEQCNCVLQTTENDNNVVTEPKNAFTGHRPSVHVRFFLLAWANENSFK